MLTYQIVGLADDNGRKYECKYGTYSKEDGFIFNEDIGELVETIGWRGIINILFHLLIPNRTKKKCLRIKRKK